MLDCIYKSAPYKIAKIFFPTQDQDSEIKNKDLLKKIGFIALAAIGIATLALSLAFFPPLSPAGGVFILGGFLGMCLYTPSRYIPNND